MRLTLVLLAVTALSTTLIAQEQPAAPEAPSPPPAAVWRVVTKESPPFAFQSADGSWRGISIELAKDIGVRLGARVEFTSVATVEEMLQAVEVGRADAAIAAITVTKSREQRVDFSHPFYSTGLGVALRDAGDGAVQGLFQAAGSSGFLQLLAVAVGGLLIVGVLFWLLERRRHPDYRDVGRRTGISTGMWWSTSILLGNKGVFPRTALGKLLAAGGMLASVLLLSVLTGAVASVLTVGRLEARVREVSDLRYLRTVAVQGTSGAEFLQSRNIPARLVVDAATGLREVQQGGADAVVHDAPILRYLNKNGSGRRVRVLDRTFDVQDYAIALGLGSPWRKPVNRALLEIRGSDEWREVLGQYIGW